MTSINSIWHPDASNHTGNNIFICIQVRTKCCPGGKFKQGVFNWLLNCFSVYITIIILSPFARQKQFEVFGGRKTIFLVNKGRVCCGAVCRRWRCAKSNKLNSATSLLFKLGFIFVYISFYFIVAYLNRTIRNRSI